jgi:predicted RecA/RadA family phage recombinase
MAGNYIQDGDVIAVTAPAAVKSGQLVVVGKLAGVAVADAASGASVTINRRGAWKLKKTSAQAWTVGADLYAAAGVDSSVTTTSTDAVLIGKALHAAANPSPVGSVLLNG